MDMHDAPPQSTPSQPARQAAARRFMTWEVGVARVEHDRSSVSPQRVADELRNQLTNPGYLDGQRRFSLGARALADDVMDLAQEDPDDLATSNYMQCAGSATAMTVEVRVSSPTGFNHYAVSRIPVADADAWNELSVDNGRITLRLHPEEVLSGQEAAEIFRAYVVDGTLPPAELLRDLQL